MQAYPVDFRRKVLETQRQNCWSKAETAAHYSISLSSVKRWSKTISIKPLPKVKKKKINDQDFLDDIEKNPDDFQYERAKRFGVSVNCIFATLKRLKITRKKKRYIIPEPVKKNEKNSAKA